MVAEFSKSIGTDGQPFGLSGCKYKDLLGCLVP